LSNLIHDFKIEIPEAALEDLKSRLANTRFPESETVDDWLTGRRAFRWIMSKKFANIGEPLMIGGAAKRR